IPLWENKGMKMFVYGYSTFPAEVQHAPERDGVYLHWKSLPGMVHSIGENKGYTLVHEASHWLGLHHTFQNGCNNPSDYVDDTPHEASAAKGCPVGRNFRPAGFDPIREFFKFVRL
ncbi:hypothetical protein H0H92_006190, partial [Tricholoma furcatifolium]